MTATITDLHEKLGGAPHSKQSLRLWLRLLTCATMIENRIRNRLRADFDTTLPRFDVLAALDRFPDGLTMGALSRCMMVSNGNVTGVVSRLESEGLISRAPSSTDRRTHFVTLTDKGRAEFADMAETHESWVDAMFDGISSAEADLLLDYLDRIKRSVLAFDEDERDRA